MSELSRKNPARVHRLSVSSVRGARKTNVPRVQVDVQKGILGDAHGVTDRQVSLLPWESFGKLKTSDFTIRPGDFAENITTIGLDFSRIKIGSILEVGQTVRLQVIQIGKECHEDCIIRRKVGDCIMPREGVFARVLNSGEVRIGDPIRVETEDNRE